MNYYNYDIVLQEVPNEISLSFSITGCNLRCVGCHSPHLWKKSNGFELTDEVLKEIIDKYTGKITCVLFMGGEWYEKELISKLDIINKLGYNTCLYTGLEIDEISDDIKDRLTYIKYGKWDNEKGGLDSDKTNQIFLSLKGNIKMNYLFNRDLVD